VNSLTGMSPVRLLIVREPCPAWTPGTATGLLALFSQSVDNAVGPDGAAGGR
jgi:hypothetical protein